MSDRLRQRLRRLARNEGGFGLIELMASLVILSIAIAGLMSIFGLGAFSLARAGHVGTATAIADRDMEYYTRAPWTKIYLVKAADTSSPNPAAPGRNYGVTSALTDSQYTTQCACPGSLIYAYSSEVADVDSHNSPAEGTTCPAPSGSPGQPDYDSEAPPTWCAAEYDILGGDNNLYRVYTYIRYGCKVTAGPGQCTYAAANNPIDYNTKIVTVIVRILAPDGSVAITTARGILAQETAVLNKNSYVGN